MRLNIETQIYKEVNYDRDFCVIVCITIYCAVLSIDINRVESFREPIFNIGYYEETGLIEYKGLGYRTVVKYAYTVDNEQKINSIEMYMFDKCIAGAIQ